MFFLAGMMTLSKNDGDGDGDKKVTKQDGSFNEKNNGSAYVFTFLCRSLQNNNNMKMTNLSVYGEHNNEFSFFFLV